MEIILVLNNCYTASEWFQLFLAKITEFVRLYLGENCKKLISTIAEDHSTENALE